jgi:predicted RND superfamily exporter protein
VETIVKRIENVIFRFRLLVIFIFILCTCILGWYVSHIRIDSGFAKNLPLKHEYIKTYIKHEKKFGGANRLMIAIQNKKGDIFTPEFFNVINDVTNELFFLSGVDRGLVSSIFTPNTRYTEVTEDGFVGGPVVPSDYVNNDEGVEKVRINVLKAGIVGRLVSNDFTCAMVKTQLLDIDPVTKERLDYIQFAEKLEKKIRDKYQTEDIGIHIIGFAKVVGDVADGIKGVVLFFFIAIVITFILVYLYSHSLKLTVIPIICSLVAVLWQLGLLTALGFGLDPMSILVPFLIFAIGVSHGMQMINAMSQQVVSEGLASVEAARASFRRLLIPGGIALLSDTVGFLTLLLIEIRVVQELAITASIGVAVIILTNLFLIPLIMSYMQFDEKYKEKVKAAVTFQNKIWRAIASLTYPKSSMWTIVIACLLLLFGLKYAVDRKIGDLHAGASVLHADSRYNKDNALVTERFSIGTDIISVIVEAFPDACIQYKAMDEIDRFQWHMENVEGVQSVISLPKIAKIVNERLNEGNIKWRALPQNTSMLVEAVRPVPTSSGLLNSDCSVIPVIIFAIDHKAETIEKIVAAVKSYLANNPSDKLKFRLATGQVGIMAATNESVKASQISMLIWVYSVVIILCLIAFRSLKATICVILPLALVSVLAQALMTLLDIGLTVHTLPVIALGVGVGVDYGIYIITPMKRFLQEGMDLHKAYFETLKTTGSAVVFTGFTLSVGVMTWIFSALKFQMDMGIILSFMFLLNMFGAILLLPSISVFLWRSQVKKK